MNTEHLVYILEAYKCGSVNKAARNCYISQSHLSTIIKNVEQEIGYPLFHRTANGITATPEGLIFMSHAEKIVTERNNIQKIPQSMSESDSLSIICARSAFVLQCFFDYKNCFPNLNRTHDKFLEAGPPGKSEKRRGPELQAGHPGAVRAGHPQVHGSGGPVQSGDDGPPALHSRHRS